MVPGCTARFLLDGCFDLWTDRILGGPDCSFRGPGAWLWLRAARTLRLVQGNLSVAATRNGCPLVAHRSLFGSRVPGQRPRADRPAAVVVLRVSHELERTQLYAFKVALEL